MTRRVLPKWKVWLFRLATVSVSGVIALLLCEGLVRLVAPQDLSGTGSERSPRGNKINRANWTMRHQVGDRVQTYRFNAEHLRGGPIGAETNRVLCIGDSFTFGWLLAEPDTYVVRLGTMAARDLPAGRFTFLNAGMSSYGTADYVAFVEDYGPAIRPRAILVFLNNDDVSRSLWSGVFQLDTNQPGRVVPIKNEAHVKPFRDALQSSRLYQWLLTHSQLYQLLRHVATFRLDRSANLKPSESESAARAAGGVALEKALFLRLRDWCRDHDCRLFVVTTGFDAFFDSDYPLGNYDPVPNKRFFAEADRFFATNGIPFHDFGPEMKAATGGDYRQVVIAKDFHPNEHGSELIAAWTWAWLKPQLGPLAAEQAK